MWERFICASSQVQHTYWLENTNTPLYFIISSTHIWINKFHISDDLKLSQDQNGTTSREIRKQVLEGKKYAHHLILLEILQPRIEDPKYVVEGVTYRIFEITQMHGISSHKLY
jgi:hypothetical protein